MGAKERPLSGMKIGIFGKGGSGKSTVTVLLAKALRSGGYEVCVLDADSTNVGMCNAIGIEAPRVALVEHYGGMVFSGGLVTCPVDDPTRLPGAEISLDLIPPDLISRSEEGICLLTAGKMGHRGAGAGCDGPIAKIARDLRVRMTGEDPVTLVDFKAGFEDSARGVVAGLDWAVVVVDPTRAALQMAVDMKETVESLKSGVSPATAHLESAELVNLVNRIYKEADIGGALCVLNRVPDARTEEYLRLELARAGLKAAAAIPADPRIADAWLKGTPIDGGWVREAMAPIVEELESAVSDPELGLHRLPRLRLADQK